jgi:hypothetical protein
MHTKEVIVHRVDFSGAYHTFKNIFEWNERMLSRSCTDTMKYEGKTYESLTVSVFIRLDSSFDYVKLETFFNGRPEAKFEHWTAEDYDFTVNHIDDETIKEIYRNWKNGKHISTRKEEYTD